MYVKVTDGVPEKYTVGRLKQENPTTSFPSVITDEFLESYSIFPAYDSPAPQIDPETQVCTQNELPTLVDGVWTFVWVVRDRTPEELAARIEMQENAARHKRNLLLLESDWTQLADSPVDTVAFASYRQALRDITDHANFPYLDESDWPNSPA